MNKLFKLLTVLLLSTFIMSCVESDDLKEDTPLNQSYVAVYNANTQKINVSSTINTNSGAFVKLSDSNTLTCNGIDYEYIIGIYSWTFDKLQDLEFELKKSNGDAFKNKISKSNFKPLDFKNEIKTISKNQDKTIFWVGDDLRPEEELAISLFQIENDVIHSYKVSDNKDKSISISKDLLKDLKDGTATIKISRTLIEDLNEDDQKAGGNKQTTFEISQEITIN